MALHRNIQAVLDLTAVAVETGDISVIVPALRRLSPDQLHGVIRSIPDRYLASLAPTIHRPVRHGYTLHEIADGLAHAMHDRRQRNPGDDERRDLERKAAEGDRGAKRRLWHAKRRAKGTDGPAPSPRILYRKAKSLIGCGGCGRRPGAPMRVYLSQSGDATMEDGRSVPFGTPGSWPMTLLLGCERCAKGDRYVLGSTWEDSGGGPDARRAYTIIDGTVDEVGARLRADGYQPVFENPRARARNPRGVPKRPRTAKAKVPDYFAMEVGPGVSAIVWISSEPGDEGKVKALWRGPSASVLGAWGQLSRGGSGGNLRRSTVAGVRGLAGAMQRFRRNPGAGIPSVIAALVQAGGVKESGDSVLMPPYAPDERLILQRLGYVSDSSIIPGWFGHPNGTSVVVKRLRNGSTRVNCYGPRKGNPGKSRRAGPREIAGAKLGEHLSVCRSCREGYKAHGALGIFNSGCDVGPALAQAAFDAPRKPNPFDPISLTAEGLVTGAAFGVAATVAKHVIKKRLQNPRAILDGFAQKHLRAWLERSVRPQDRIQVTRAIVRAVREDPSVLDTHSWPEIARRGANPAARGLTLYSWRWNVARGWVWQREREVTPETGPQWLATFQKDEPQVTFVISAQKPRKPGPTTRQNPLPAVAPYILAVGNNGAKPKSVNGHRVVRTGRWVGYYDEQGCLNCKQTGRLEMFQASACTAGPRRSNPQGQAPFRVSLPADKVLGTMPAAEAMRRWPQAARANRAALADFNHGGRISSDLIIYDDGSKDYTVGWIGGRSPEITYGGPAGVAEGGLKRGDGYTPGADDETLWVHKSKNTYLVGVTDPREAGKKHPTTRDFRFVGSMVAKKRWLRK